MKRTFKLYSVTNPGTPQPVVGTTSTNAVFANTAPQSVLVADSFAFRSGDYAFFGVGATAERVQVLRVPDATHIQVILNKNHGAGIYVTLSLAMTAVYIQRENGGAGSLYIFYPDQQFSASQVPPVIAGRIKCICELKSVAVGVQPTEFSSANNFGANPDDLAYFWVDGDAADFYLPSVDIT